MSGLCYYKMEREVIKMGIIQFFRRGMPDTSPKELSFCEALGYVKEGRELALECGCDKARLHCRGCVNYCLLERARCPVGKNIVSALEGGIGTKNETPSA